MPLNVDLSLRYELALAIGASLDVDDNIKSFLRTLVIQFDLDYAGCYLIDPNNSAQLYRRQFIPKAIPGKSHVELSSPTYHFLSQRPVVYARGRDFPPSIRGPEFDDEAAIIAFQLPDVGALYLARSNPPRHFGEAFFQSIYDLVLQFSISVAGTLAHSTLRDQYKGEEDLRAFYEQILEALPAQLAVFDTDGRYAYVNPQAISTPELRELAIGRTDVDYAAARGRDPLVGAHRLEYIKQVVETGKTFTFDEQFPDNNGQLRYFRRFVSPVRDAEGKVLQVIGYGLDITEQMEKAHVAQAALEQADRSLQVREHFLANMSHEMRTPLNAVAGMVTLLRQTTLSTEQQHYTVSIDHAATHLLTLINDVLDLAKIGSGSIQFERRPYSLRRVVSRVIEVSKAIFDADRLDLTWNAPEKSSDWVLGDPTRLQQVLTNLVSNAIKFTPHGGVSVSLEIIHQDDRSWVSGRVTDTGIGISPEDQERIFDRFVQLDDEAKRKYGGSGLGLAIAKELVLRQGGTMNVRSELGRGATFSFRIPTSVVSETNETADSTMPLQPRVLVVDDDDASRLIAARLAIDVSSEVLSAATGAEAIEVCRNHHVDIVLMDIQMPNMDGVEAMRRIKTLPQASRTKFVALTASILAEQRDQFEANGFSDILMKPAQQADLHEVIVATHRKAMLQREMSDALTQFTGGDRQLTTEILKVALASVNAFLETLHNPELPQRNEIARLAHRWSPTARMLGLNKINKRLHEVSDERQSDLRWMTAARALRSSLGPIQRVLNEMVVLQSDPSPTTDHA